MEPSRESGPPTLGSGSFISPRIASKTTLNLAAVSTLQRDEFARQILVRRNSLSQSNEGPHDLDVYLNSAFTIENRGEHGDTPFVCCHPRQKLERTRRLGGVLSTRLEPVAGCRRGGYLKSANSGRWTYRARYSKADIGGPVSNAVSGEFSLDDAGNRLVDAD
jgi:hypothetical protein